MLQYFSMADFTFFLFLVCIGYFIIQLIRLFISIHKVIKMYESTRIYISRSDEYYAELKVLFILCICIFVCVIISYGLYLHFN